MREEGSPLSPRSGRCSGSSLLRCRMHYAACLLERPGVQIKQGADLCGVSDPARFSRMFKHKFGMSPKFYQKSIPVESDDAGFRMKFIL